MSRILICERKQEISSFNPASGRYKDYPDEPGTYPMPAADFPAGRPCGMDARSAHF